VKSDNKMKPVKNELLFIYNSNDILEREAYGYVSSMVHHKLRSIDLYKENLTELQLKNIVDLLGKDLKDIWDKTSEKYRDEYLGGDFDEQDMFKVLINNPEMIKTPIAIYDEMAFIADSAYDFISKDLEV